MRLLPMLQLRRTNAGAAAYSTMQPMTVELQLLLCAAAATGGFRAQRSLVAAHNADADVQGFHCTAAVSSGHRRHTEQQPAID